MRLPMDVRLAAQSARFGFIFTRSISGDAHEGVTSFREKRQAVYLDRVSTDMPGYFPWWDEPNYG
jgi:hypothetical protein